MEAIGSASAILQVLDTAVTVYLALSDYATAVKGAPKRSRELRDEARLLTEALKVLKAKTTRSHHSLSDASAVKAMRDGIDEVMTILKELDSRMHVSKGDVYQRLKWPFSESETDKYLRKFQRYNILFQTILHSLESAMEHTGQITERKVTDMYTMSLDREGDVGSRHRTISSGRVENSGRWLLESPSYKGWMEGKGSDVFTYHGHGKIPLLGIALSCIAGVGKTVLASLVIDDIAESLKEQNFCVVHIYFDYKDSDNQTTDCIVRRLIKQLLIPLDLVPRDLETLYHDHRRRLRLPDIDSMIRIWESLSMKFSTVFAVFDGIDECNGRARGEILGLINKLRRPNVKILCTFRSHVLSAIIQQFKDAHVQKVEAHGEDIRNYLSERLNREWQHHPALIPIIVDSIVDKATGQSVPFLSVSKLANLRFLLVQYQLDNILSFAEPRDAMKALDSLPRELEGLYQEIMQRIEKGHKSPALKILSWLFHTKRPMKIYELREALAVQPRDRELIQLYLMNPDTIVQCCQSLVELDEDGDIVRFAHVTIHEFLENEYINTLHTPVELGKVCLTYLNFDEFDHPCPTKEAFEERLRTYEFFDYATSHTGAYIKGLGEDDPQIADQLIRFLKSPQRCAAYLQELYRLKEFVPPEDLEGTTALHVVSTMGLADLYNRGRNPTSEFHRVLHGGDINAPTYSLTTSLMCAAALGHLEMTLALIADGAKVNLQDDQGMTAVVHASIRGYHEVAVELMNHGADPNVTTDFGTALEIVSLLGHQKLVQSLLERVTFETSPTLIVEALRLALSYESTEKAAQQARLDEEEEMAHLFLTIFSSSGHKEVERTLLDHCKDTTLIKANSDLLHLAVESEHGEIVLGLLEKEVDVEARNSKGQTPLHVAASLGNNEIVFTLLRKGANIAIQDHAKLTAIHHAVLGGRVDILSALLVPHADVDAPDSDGWTPLHYAASVGNSQIVSLLLERGADTMAETIYFLSPLHLASYSGQVEAVKSLLTAGARIETRENDRRTPLLLAAKMGHLETVLALLESGADLLAQDKDGMNAIHHAAATTKRQLVEMLLERGLELESWDGNGMTPLLHAAKGGRIENVLMLLKKGADWSTLDHNGMTALHHAAAAGNIECIKALMASGIDLNLRDAFDQTALAKAALANNRDAVLFLMEANAVIEADADGDLHLLHMMASGGTTEILLSLLRQNFDINSRDEKGQTALMKAAENGHHDAVEALMKHDADADIQDNEGMTALMSAVLAGHQFHMLTDRTNLNIREHDGYSVLHYAVLKNQVALIELLLAKGADISPRAQRGFTPLHMAAAKGFIDTVPLLLKWGADTQLLDEDGWTALHFAAQNGHSEVATELLNTDHSLISATDHSGRTALHLAAAGGFKKAAKVLLNHGADLGCRDDRGWTALHSAASCGQRLTIIELVRQGIDVNCPDFAESTPLHVAALKGQIKGAKELLTLNGNIDATNANGNSPLHEAAMHGKMDMVKFLINHKADLKTRSTFGSSTLHAAVYGKDMGVISLLLQHDLDVDAQDSDGLTPLHLATRSENHEIAVALLDAGANVEVKDQLGRTPLHLAAMEMDVNILAVLIDRGANLQAKSKEGLRAISYAFQAYDVDATFFLLQLMIQTSTNESPQSNIAQDRREATTSGTAEQNRTNKTENRNDNFHGPDESVRVPISLHTSYRKHTERLGCELWNDGLTFEACATFDHVIDTDPSNLRVRNLAEVVHSNVRCCSCKKEIRGIRWRCTSCQECDFCKECYENGDGRKHFLWTKHGFVRTPSELWWPGDF